MASDELHEATGQVAALAQAGLPLASGLRALAEEVPSGRVRRALHALSSRLEAGQSLDAVLGGSTRLIPPPLRALLTAAAGSGNLSLLLDRYLTLARVNRDLRRRLWLTLAYPLVLIVAALGVVAFFVLWLVPQFKDIFEGFGVELPVVTTSLLLIWAVRFMISPTGTTFCVVVKVVVEVLALEFVSALMVK